MTEERFQLLVEKYLEGTLSDAEARELIEAPEPWRGRLLDEVSMAGLLSRVEGKAPADLASKVQAALRARPEKDAMVARVIGHLPAAPGRRLLFRSFLALAAAAMVVIALSAVLGGPKPPPPPDPEPVAEAPPPSPGRPPMSADAKRAVAKAVAYLRKAKLPPATHNAPMPPDELILLALVNAGVSPQDPMVVKLLDQVLQARPQRTYCISLQAVVLARLDPVRYRDRIAECAQFLVDNQCLNGQWSYGAPTVKPAGSLVKKTRDGPLSGNNSCSNFAAMGLRACVDAGIRIPVETFDRAARAWRESQRMEADGRGGWCYTREENPHRPYASMSAGGLSALVICDRLSGKDWRQDKAALVGRDWVTYHYTPIENYGPVEELMAKEMISDTPNANTEIYYYLWAVERAAAVCGLETFGARDWYAEGSREILAAQRRDGSWFSGVKRCQPVYDTCYAILFLTRSTRPMGN